MGNPPFGKNSIVMKPVVRGTGRRGCNCSHGREHYSTCPQLLGTSAVQIGTTFATSIQTSPWPTVGLARVDAPPGGDDKTAELAVVILIVGSFGTLTEWSGRVVHSTDQSFAVGVENLLSAVRVNVGWEGHL